MAQLMVGAIIHILEDVYRLIYVQPDACVLCRMNTTKLILNYFETAELRRMIRNQEAVLTYESDNNIVSFDTMDEKDRARFIRIKKMLNDVAEAYGPTYIGLMGKGTKKPIEKILTEYQMPRNSFWIYVKAYIQSGFQDSSLVDKRSQKKSTGPNRHVVKAGRKRFDGLQNGVVLTQEVINQFEEFLQLYKKGRERTYKNAYAGLIEKYYTDSDGSRLPQSMIPTYNQFYFYCSQHISQKEKDIKKTSAQEQRNAKRLLLGSARKDAIRPGWIVEADAVEADFSIVSAMDKEQSIGRPIVYFLLDVQTSAIVAVSISLENNSMIGLTNLFLNLGDDKAEYAAKYGIEFDSGLWPSNFLPNEIRCDRGSDFKSHKFGEVCKRLGIIRTLEPGATGSLKSIVEQSFHQFQSSLRPEMIKKGLITERYGSNHHREAMLDIYSFTQLVINYVLMHNQRYMEGYPMGKEMYQKDIKPAPCTLWKYFCEIKGNPRPISQATYAQYLYDLLPEKQASLSRKGVILSGLHYINHESKLLEKMFRLGTKREKMKIRYDPRDVGIIYYMEDNKLCTLHLNDGIPNNAEYAGMTWAEYNEYDAHRRKLNREGKEHNLSVDMNLSKTYRNIIAANTTEHLANTTGIRDARCEEKNRINNENRVAQRLEKDEKQLCEEQMEKVSQNNPEHQEEDKNKDPFAPNLDFRAAMDMFEEGDF